MEYSISGRWGGEGGKVRPGRDTKGISAISVMFLFLKRKRRRKRKNQKQMWPNVSIFFNWM